MHSTVSDGKLSPEDALQWYIDAGYDFVSLTDHRDTTIISHDVPDDFLVIPGSELDCFDEERNVGYHIVGVGIEPFAQDETTRRGPGQTLIDAIRQHGGEAILAHPYWLGQGIDDMAITQHALGIEVFNASCALAGKEYGMVHWDGLLDRGIKLWGLATDDTHRYADDVGRGWIMVKAPELTEQAIMKALRQGHFYATQGPTIQHIRFDKGKLTVHCSPVKEIRFIMNRGRGKRVLAEDGGLLHAASMPTREEGYVRIECIDENGLRAWSQPLFMEEVQAQHT